MQLGYAILEAESKYEKTNIHQCVVNSNSFATLNMSETNDIIDWLVIGVDTIRHYPSLNIYYDTYTKSESQEERRGFIINKLYELGFEASPYNNDLALNKFYSLEREKARIRIELAKNGIVNIFLFDREGDSTNTIIEFFNPYILSDVLNKVLTKDEMRELRIDNILK
jgi:hypothetical protein